MKKGNLVSLTLAVSTIALLTAGPALAGSVIKDVNTNQARYAPGSAVTIYVDVSNTTGNTITNGTVTVYCKQLNTLLATLPVQTITLAPGATTTLIFTWTPPSTDYQGYAIEAWARNSSGAILDNINSAVDVSSTWTKFPRYGFLASYPSQTNATSSNLIWQMKNYHINGVQFYDWQYKHHQPLAGTVANPAASWTGLDNHTIYRQTVLDLINASHTYAMSAMNYNLLYGAWSNYGADGVDYHGGLWKSNNGTNQDSLPMPGGWATPAIYLFNPGDAAWQNYIFAQEAKVFSAYPFDGWHVDQVGDRAPEYSYSGTPIDVWTTFRPFLNNAKSTLRKTIIFNNVGAYGLYDTAANSTEDAVYVECWPFTGQTTYNDLKTTVDQSSSWSGGKGVILAAYMNYNYANGFSNASPGNFNLPGVLLTDATIFASGGSHIELGDNLTLLDSEYFPNHNLVPTPALKSALRNYYDFLVAYQNLLRGGLSNSTNAISLSVPASINASANTVWNFAKVGNGYHVLHLINLRGETNTAWRDDNANYPVPTPQTNITVKYYYGSGTVNSVNWATPDSENGKSNALTFTTGTDSGGKYARFVVPSLAYWDMIYLKML